MEEEQPVRKRRKLHLDVVESVRLSQSEEGTASLRQPINRSHPTVSLEKAMAPRHHRRFRHPRRVSSQIPGGAWSGLPGTVSGEHAGLGIANSDQKSESGGQSGMGQERVQQSRTAGSLSVQGKPGTSATLEEEVILLDKESSPATTSTLEEGDKHSSLQGCSVNHCDETEWGNEDEEKEMVEQSSDRSIHLLSVLGGFRPAASLQEDSSRCRQNSGSWVTSPPRNNDKGAGSRKPGKKQRTRDTSQSWISSFMSCKVPSTASCSAASSSTAASAAVSQAASTSRDTRDFEPQRSSAKVVYGSPSKMYSPIKKMPETDSVYVISDDSSQDSSQGKTSERTDTSSQLQQSNPAVKSLFMPASSSKSCERYGTKRKKPITSTQPRLKAKVSKRKKYKVQLESVQRTLGSISLTPSLAHIDFYDADEEDFANISASVPPVRQEVNVGPTFGLLNDSRVKTVEENLFERLPRDIVENIFCSLPMTDLCLSLSRVCLSWHNIISSSQFMPWKKTYHKLKKNDEESKTYVNLIMEQEDMCEESTRLLNLISFMQKLKVVTPDNNACKLLQSHPKYALALALLEDKAPHCIKENVPNPWNVICALVMVSTTVEDIHCGLRLLTSTQSRLFCCEVLECFYCIATFLLAFKNKIFQLPRTEYRRSSIAQLWGNKNGYVGRGLHYRVFYALYLYENSFMSNHAMLQEAMATGPGQQSLVKYSLGETPVRLTHEQMRIVRYTPGLRTGEIIKIFAFAGTGKTTTLLRYTQFRPQLKFLFIVFNKSVCSHAKEMFPRQNVTCKTVHSLAFAATGKRYADKKQLNAGNLRVYDIAMALEKRGTNKENLFVRAKFVMETLKNFLSSSDEFITAYHAPSQKMGDSGAMDDLDFNARMRYAEDAARYWKRMQDLHDVEVRITHDGYLKLYQLRKPILKGYDIILVDEAQDLTPAVLDIVRTQTQPKIFVGDQYQQIYAFKGTVSAMEIIDAQKVFYLTQSFRFGPEIAQVANTVLETFKVDKTKNIVGHGTPGTVSGEQVGQLAILCRSNFTVFAEAVKYCVHSDTPARVAFVGGLDGFGFDILEDIYTLMLPIKDRRNGNLCIKNKFIARFSNVAELARYALKTMDMELMSKLRIVRTYQHDLLRYITMIRAKVIKDTKQADVVLSTVHKSKGLEFSTVKIAEDFLYLHGRFDGSRRLVSMKDEESNLLYVAVTRAKQALIMSKRIRQMLTFVGGGCYQPMLTDKLTADGVELRCLVSKKKFKPQVLTLYRPKVTLGTKETVEAGVLSPAVLRAINSEYSCLLDGDADSDTMDNSDNESDYPSEYAMLA